MHCIDMLKIWLVIILYARVVWRLLRCDEVGADNGVYNEEQIYFCDTNNPEG